MWMILITHVILNIVLVCKLLEDTIIVSKVLIADAKSSPSSITRMKHALVLDVVVNLRLMWSTDTQLRRSGLITPHYM